MTQTPVKPHESKTFDHAYFETHTTVARYLKDQVQELERVAFEDHFPTCEACLEALELTQAMSRDMKQVPVEAFSGRVSFWLWLRAGWRYAALLAASVLVAAVLPIWWLGGNGAASSLNAVPSVSMEVTRGPINPVLHTQYVPGTDSLVLSYDLHFKVEESYHVTLKTESGQLIWKRRYTPHCYTDLLAGKASEDCQLIVVVSPRQVPPGNYLLSIAIPKPGQDEQLYASFSVRIHAPNIS